MIKFELSINVVSNSSEIAIRWMPHDLTKDRTILVQVRAITWTGFDEVRNMGPMS